MTDKLNYIIYPENDTIIFDNETMEDYLVDNLNLNDEEKEEYIKNIKKNKEQEYEIDSELYKLVKEKLKDIDIIDTLTKLYIKTELWKTL